MSEAKYHEQKNQEEEELKSKPKNPNLEKLRKSSCIKFSGRIFGLLIPTCTLVFMSLFTFFGPWDIRGTSDCWAVEFPDTTQYSV